MGEERFDEPGGVQVFLNAEGALESEPFWEEHGFFTFSSALGDIDGDGDLDLAVAAGEAYYNEPESSLLFCNDQAYLYPIPDFSLFCWLGLKSLHPSG